MTEKSALPDWPYPRWIAHRGAGTLAPENTLAAFRLGASYGYRMFECDVKLSRDGVPFLLHDDTLTRTAHALHPHHAPDPQASAVAGDYPWHTLAQYDAGGWHSSAYAGEPLPTLAQIARFCISNSCFLNIEIKPTTGTERQTGEVVAQHAARLWHATRLQCQAIVCNYELWNTESVALAKAAGFRLLSYTVNDDAVAAQLQGWGTDGIITDRVDHFVPSA